MSQPRTPSSHRRLSSTLAASALVVASLLASPPSAPAETFLRGDANGDGQVGLTDVLSTVGFLFLRSNTLACPDAADANDTGTVDVADTLFTLSHLYMGGSAPPSPGLERCGLDPTFDALGPCSSAYCETGRGDGPGPLELPPDNAVEVAAMFAKGLVQDAVTRVLNSTGDSIDLHLKGSVSVAPIVPGVPVNVSISLDPSIQRTEDGGFELSISLEGAGGIGVELYEGVEAGVMDVMKSRIICRFGSLAEALEAVERLVAAKILLPLGGAAVDILAAFEALAQQLEQAVNELGVSRKAEQAIRAGITAAQGTIAGLERQINNLSKPIRDAQAEIQRLENAVAAGCGKFPVPGCGALRDSLRAARAGLGELDRQKAAFVRQLGSMRSELGSLQGALQPAVDAVRAAEELVGQLDEAIAAVREDAERAQDVLAVIARSEGTLRATAAAFEYRKSQTARVEAFLSPFPGVKLEGAGLGAELSVDAGVTARVEVAFDGGFSGLTLTFSEEVKLSGTYALMVGAKGSASLQLAAILGFDFSGEQFVEVGGTMELTVDAQVVAIVGIGATLQYGAGTKLGLSLDLSQGVDAAGGLWSLARTGDAAALVEALSGLEATYTRQDRRIAAAVAAISAGKLGNGAGIEASVTWSDQGALTTEDLPIGEGVVSIFESDAVSDLVDMLQEVAMAPRS